MSEPIDAAVKKLTAEDEKLDKKSIAKSFSEYLIEKCQKDEDFSEKVNQEQKTIEKCLAYVTQKARDYLGGHSGGVEDNIVFGWVSEYYNLDDAAIEAEKKRKKEEADKQAAEDRAKAEERRKQVEAEKKEGEAKKKAEKAAEKKQDAGQISFF